MVTHQVARVMLWGEFVGALAYNEATGFSAFEYAPGWLRKGVEISPIRLPLGRRKYLFSELPYATYRGLPAAFADTLPDDFGNAVIDAWLAKQGRDPGSFSPVERLLYTGRRGMGALEYHPEFDQALTRTAPLRVDALVAMAQQVIDGRAALQVAIDREQRGDGLESLFQVGTSAGGARAKAVVAVNRERTELRSGQLDCPEGFEHFILKFDGVVDSNRTHQTFGDPQGYGRMEYAYYLMARDAGIHISHCELLEEGERAHFMTRRFDRIGNEKLHFQSLCAMDHADYKKPGHYSYEQLFGLMRRLRLDRRSALEMYRRMVFNIVARNQDDHPKNVAFIRRQGGDWRLAPAFDLAYSFRADSPWVASHQMTLNGKRDQFVLEDLLAPAATFAREAREIIETVREVVSRWPDYAAQAGVAEPFAAAIGKHHRLVFS
jgi:serine/threonine-protein kinase HipA